MHSEIFVENFIENRTILQSVKILKNLNIEEICLYLLLVNLSFLIPVKILNLISNKNSSLLAFWKRTVNANRMLMTQIDEPRSSATLYASLFHEANGESNGYGGYCWSCQNREVKYLLTSFIRYERNYRTCGFPVKRTAVYGVPLFGANCPLSNKKNYDH